MVRVGIHGVYCILSSQLTLLLWLVATVGLQFTKYGKPNTVQEVYGHPYPGHISCQVTQACLVQWELQCTVGNISS